MTYYVVTKGYGKKQEVCGVFEVLEDALSVLHRARWGKMYTFLTATAKNRFAANPSLYLRHTAWSEVARRGRIIVRPEELPREVLVNFSRLLIEGDSATVNILIDDYPALLINRFNAPRTYGSLNPLQIAAALGFTNICKGILDAVNSPTYRRMYENRTACFAYELGGKLIDIFLNMPERTNLETPLHLAVKFGHAGVVKLLMSYPQCELKKNINELLPNEIICRDATPENNTHSIRNALRFMLKENYFVPLIRTKRNVVQPYLGEPFSRQNVLNLNTRRNQNLRDKRYIAALAGPMTMEAAIEFFETWKNSPYLGESTPDLDRAFSGKLY